MHYFDFNIKSYQAATSHLTNEEDLAYRRLIEMYYDTEQPIPTDNPVLTRRLRVGLPSLESVLKEFFKPTDIGWIHPYCDAVIAEYHAYTKRQSINGRKGGRPSKPSANPVVSQNNPVPSQPLTINNKQETRNQDKYKPPIGDKLLADWLEVRKAKRAGKLTETAFNGLAREAALANITPEQAVQVCCERSWQSFKAEWYAKASARGNGGVQEARLKVAQQIFGDNYGTDRPLRDITPGRTIEGDSKDISKAISSIR